MAARIVIADDHPMCREAARMALAVADPDALHDAVGSLAEARAVARGADLLTLDLALPDSRGMIGLIELAGRFPQLPILVITGSEQPGIERRARGAGARGFLSKAAAIPDMIQAMRTMLGGGTWFSDAADTGIDPVEEQRLAKIASLTPAQSRILAAMHDGRLNKQIAHDIGLSEITVKAHVKAILRKLAVVNRTQAVLMVRDLELTGRDAASP